MSKNGAAICIEMWKKESGLSCFLTEERTQLFSPPSTAGVMSGVRTWVSQVWLAPGQTEVKPRAVHAISTKRKKPLEGRGGWANLKLWGVVFSDKPRGGESEGLPRVAVQRNKLIGLLANSSLHIGEKQIQTVFFIAVYRLNVFHNKIHETLEGR